MSRRAWLAFAATFVIWGIPYLFIRIAVRGGVTPFVLAWGRVTLAAVVAPALAWRAGTLSTLRGRWRWLVGALLAMRFDQSERPTPLRALGLVIGFGGVVALVGIDVAGRAGELLGTGAILLAAVGYSIGPMIIKHRLAGLDPRATIGASLAVALRCCLRRRPRSTCPGRRPRPARSCPSWCWDSCARPWRS